MINAYINMAVVTVNDKNDIIENGYLLIKGDTIIEVGHMDDFVDDNYNIKDMKSFIAMPGLINAHTHLGLILLRSLKDDQKDRLRKYLFPMEQKYMSKDNVLQASLYGALESLLSGVTTVCDMYFYSEDVAKLLDKVSIRAFVGQTILEESQIDYKDEMSALAKSEEFILKFKDNDLIKPMIAPHSPVTVSKEALFKTKDLSDKYNTLVMMHVSEFDYEMEYFKPNSPIDYLNDLGLLNERFLSVHTIFTNDKDRKTLFDTKSNVVYCPIANMKSGKGISSVAEMLDLGVNVALGTDGPISGNTLDLISNLKVGVISQKTKYNNRELLKTEEAIRLMTINGAKALGIDHLVGSIEIGKKADLIFIETESANMFPIYDYNAAIVYQLMVSNIDTVLVNGKVLVSNKQLEYYDLDKVKDDLADIIYNISLDSEH